MSVKFCVCHHCGNVVEMVKDTKVPVVCCGEKMEVLTANTVEASQEKHLPAVTIVGNELSVKVGSVAHPMLEEHSILWVYLETEHGCQRKFLKPGEEPEVKFTLTDDIPVAVYAYCNIHGLWKTEI